MMMAMYQTRLSFSHILNTHRITMITLAKEIGLPRTVVHAMLMGKPVSADLAQTVLMGLSRLTGGTYTLQNVRITLRSIGNVVTQREVIWQCPTQPLRVIKQSERAVQDKSRSIISYIFGFILGGVQWRGSY